MGLPSSRSGQSGSDLTEPTQPIADDAAPLCCGPDGGAGRFVRPDPCLPAARAGMMTTMADLS